MQESLGVDIGNVIIDHAGFGTTPEFVQDGDYNVIPPVAGVFDALRKLNDSRFRGNIFIAYNASGIADQKIISWLKNQDFFTRTGITPDRVKRTQNNRNKLSLCEFYQATHFIDDRLEVLSHLIGKVKNLYLLRPQPEEIEQHQDHLAHVRVCESWEQVLMITGT